MKAVSQKRGRFPALFVFVFSHYFLPFPRRSPSKIRAARSLFFQCFVPVPVMVARREPDRAITRAAAANKLHIIAAARSNPGNNIVEEIRAATTYLFRDSFYN